MSEHFPKSTLTATAWCLKCRRNTEHQIDDGRKGRCLDPGHPSSGEPSSSSYKYENLPEQKDLFEK